MTQISSTTPSPLAGIATTAPQTAPEGAVPEAPRPSSTAVDPLVQFGAMHGLHPGVQHLAYADKNGGGGQTNSTTGTTHAKSAPVHARTQQELKELAQDPAAAHKAWKSLNTTERDAVVKEMGQRYGKDFAQKFADAAKSGKADLSVTYWQPGTGPSKEKLLEQGYRPAGKEITGNAAWDIDLWVHPSGKLVRKDVSTYKFKESEADKPGGTGTGAPSAPDKTGPAAKMPPFIDPEADRNKLFGEVVAIKEDVDAAFGRGDMLRYKDGTLELFVEGEGGKSYVFVPIKDRPGQYAVYGLDGHRLNDKAWSIPPGDIPDPVADAVDD
jgi:hypothetical protein